MEIEQLRQLVTVARTGSVSAAADELGFSQPALSRSIKRLEADLGCELLERTKNSVQLNDAGRVALGYAEEIIRSERNLRRDLDDLSGRDQTFRIGTCAPAPLWHLTSLLVQTVPGVMICPQMMSEDEVERAVFNRDVNFGITLKALPLPGMESVPILRESLMLAVPNDDPLATRESVTWSEVDGRTFLIYADIGFWWDITKRELPRAKFVRQEDREMLRQLGLTSSALMFTTDATDYLRLEGRTAVPIVDDDAHALFYVVMPTSTDEKLRHAIRGGFAA